ncbi:MAG: alginate export family protein [Planctomycetota bacterium]
MKQKTASSRPHFARTTSACLATLLTAAATAQTAPSPASDNSLDFSNGQAPSDFFDALASGTVKGNIRFRSEFADVRGFEDSWANTVRTRLGYETQEWQGFKAYVELEDIRAMDDDRYNAAGLNGQPSRSVIADPEDTELNQLWASYSVPVDGVKLTLKPGRQVIAFDDQRFVGHVGWRQDNQTFDAASVMTDLGLDGLAVQYSYLWQINRIFGEFRDWDSDSHLLNVSYDVNGLGKLTGFAYLLDFSGDSPANSSQTYGVRLAGKKQIDETFTLPYQASVAFQEDYADNPVDYDAIYYMVDAGLAVKDIGTFGAGYEVLGSDDGNFAFRTPLATGHKFNGFADVFLVTPNDGLEDVYVYFAPANLPWGLKGKVAYHWFSGNEDIASYGQEIDAVLTKKINDNLSVGAKYAYFMTDEPGFAERTRITFDLTLSF